MTNAPRLFFTLACFLFGVSLLAAGLWPFNFQADNLVDLLPITGGLVFKTTGERSKQNRGGIAYTPNPLSCSRWNDCVPGTIAIKLVLSVENEYSSCVKRIIDLRRPDDSKAFYLGQWKSSLIVRSFNTPPALGRRYREIGVGGVLTKGQRRLIEIFSRPRGTDIQIDGKSIWKFPGIRLLRDNETLEGHKMYLGNSRELSCPWAGNVLSLSFYGNAFASDETIQNLMDAAGSLDPCPSGTPAVACYRFDVLVQDTLVDLSGSSNHLRKPRHLVFDKGFLGLPDTEYFSASDVAFNLLGFAPFGFLLCLRMLNGSRLLLHHCFLFAVGLGFAVSLAIELTQVWLPGRDSSFLDLIANTIGSAIGAAMACHVGRTHKVIEQYSQKYL